MLLTAVKSFAPAVVLVDKHPFGASGEFRAGLDLLRTRRQSRARPARHSRRTGTRLANGGLINAATPSRNFRRDSRLRSSHVFDPIALTNSDPSGADATSAANVANRDGRKTADDLNGGASVSRTADAAVVLATAAAAEMASRCWKTFVRARRAARAGPRRRGR